MFICTHKVKNLINFIGPELFTWTDNWIAELYEYHTYGITNAKKWVKDMEFVVMAEVLTICARIRYQLKNKLITSELRHKKK